MGSLGQLFRKDMLGMLFYVDGTIQMTAAGASGAGGALPRRLLYSHVWGAGREQA
jgi:hypothetical protein